MSDWNCRIIKPKKNRTRSNSSKARKSQAHPAPPEMSIPTPYEERVHRILGMIASKPPCTIDELALELNLSHSHLRHLFKQQTGVCLGHMLNEKRMQKAADLLTRSHLRIKEIAYAVGYEHSSSFIRAFERHFRQAPQIYRQQSRRMKS